jgi:hypothetical protein
MGFGKCIEFVSFGTCSPKSDHVFLVLGSVHDMVLTEPSNTSQLLLICWL